MPAVTKNVRLSALPSGGWRTPGAGPNPVAQTPSVRRPPTHAVPHTSRTPSHFPRSAHPRRTSFRPRTGARRPGQWHLNQLAERASPPLIRSNPRNARRCPPRFLTSRGGRLKASVQRSPSTNPSRTPREPAPRRIPAIGTPEGRPATPSHPLPTPSIPSVARRPPCRTSSTGRALCRHPSAPNSRNAAPLSASASSPREAAAPKRLSRLAPSTQPIQSRLPHLARRPENVRPAPRCWADSRRRIEPPCTPATSVRTHRPSRRRFLISRSGLETSVQPAPAAAPTTHPVPPLHREAARERPRCCADSRRRTEPPCTPTTSVRRRHPNRNVRPHRVPTTRQGGTASAGPGVSGPRNHTGPAPRREKRPRAVTPTGCRQRGQSRRAGVTQPVARSGGCSKLPRPRQPALLPRRGTACAGPESPTRSGTRSAYVPANSRDRQ